MTLAEISARLSAAGIDNAAFEARALVAHFEKLSPAMLLAERERDYSSPALLAAVERRSRREPLQYLLGSVGFFEEEYEVSPACLIPRADTELLVETAIRLLPKGARFADLCTGSGCIAVSVLAHRPDLSALAVDISEETLHLAARNAERNGVKNRVCFLSADLLSDALPKDLYAVDAILSNPPYIRAAAMQALSRELAFEPSIALYGGEDGLIFYRAMLDKLSPSLFLFEIGYDQKDEVLALGAAHGYRGECLRDTGGNDRVILLSK